MNRAATALLVALGALALVGGVATAHEEKFETKVKLRHSSSPSGDSFTGKVRARGGCKEGRTVKVYHLLEYGGERELVGTATSDAEGEYEVSINGPAAKGNYQARAKRLVLGDHTCKRGASKVKAVK
jgi:hypothetical protein